MAKVLYSLELIDLVEIALTSNVLSQEQRAQFAEGLGQLVADAFGAELRSIGAPNDNLPDPPKLPIRSTAWQEMDQGYCFSFDWTDQIQTGSVWEVYDPDITIEQWREDTEAEAETETETKTETEAGASCLIR